jgi:hypothetical protein
MLDELEVEDGVELSELFVEIGEDCKCFSTICWRGRSCEEGLIEREDGMIVMGMMIDEVVECELLEELGSLSIYSIVKEGGG